MVTITATQTGGLSGSDVYAPATAMETILVKLSLLQPQAITFNEPANDVADAIVSQTIPLMASTDASGLFVRFSFVTTPPTGVATLTDAGDGTGTLTLTGAGTVTVTASQDGNGTYEAATPVSRTITVTTVSSLSQIITFSDPAGDVADAMVNQTITLAATTDAMDTDLFVRFSIVTTPTTGVATLTDNADGTGLLTLNGEGTVAVTASQDGNANYEAAKPVTRTITVSKQTQTIMFSTPSGDTTEEVGEDISLTATTNAMGLFVTFSIVTNPTRLGLRN